MSDETANEKVAPKTIRIKFSCDKCGLKDVEIEVRARESHEDVVWWMKEVVGMAIYHKHLVRSVFCDSTSAQNVMLPKPKDPNGWIGMWEPDG